MCVSPDESLENTLGLETDCFTWNIDRGMSQKRISRVSNTDPKKSLRFCEKLLETVVLSIACGSLKAEGFGDGCTQRVPVIGHN